MADLRREIDAAARGPAAVDAAGTATRRYRFGAAFAGFQGHFPGDPILPAVVLLLAAVSVAGDGEGRALRLAGVRSARFVRPIRPGEEIVVRCRVRSDGAERLHDVEIAAPGGPAASALLRLVDAREAR